MFDSEYKSANPDAHEALNAQTQSKETFSRKLARQRAIAGVNSHRYHSCTLIFT